MLFRPTFCCNCGEKIDRAEWRLWTSRRFCELCATEFPLQDYAVKGVILLAAAVTLLGVARMFTATKPAELASKRSIERPQNNIAERNTASATPEPRASVPVSPSNAIEDRTTRTLAAMPPANVPKVPVEVAEPVYICGAATKKGTPCSRKVKGNVRCWQHIGQPAMLPPDQLRVTR
jgi:hypothetical protein